MDHNWLEVDLSPVHFERRRLKFREVKRLVQLNSANVCWVSPLTGLASAADFRRGWHRLYRQRFQEAKCNILMISCNLECSFGDLFSWARIPTPYKLHLSETCCRGIVQTSQPDLAFWNPAQECTHIIHADTRAQCLQNCGAVRNLRNQLIQHFHLSVEGSEAAQMDHPIRISYPDINRDTNNMVFFHHSLGRGISIKEKTRKGYCYLI